MEDRSISERRIGVTTRLMGEVERENRENDDGGLWFVEEKMSQKTSPMKKIIVAVCIVGLATLIAIDSATNGHVMEGFRSFLKWVENHPVPGVFATAAVYFVATVFFIPGSILTLGSGFVFANAFGLGVGLVLGTMAVLVGASAGAVVAFLIGRYVLRDWVKILAAKYAVFEAVDKVLEDKGIRIMVLLRLSPLIPFNALNYIAGITGLSLKDNTTALLAIIPGTVFYVFLGASAGSLADIESRSTNNVVTIVVIVVGLVFGVLAIVATSYYAKRELKNVVVRQEGKAEAPSDGEDNAPTTKPYQVLP